MKDKEVLIGNRKLMDIEGIAYKPAETVGTIVYVAVDGIFIGSITISDELKRRSKDTISMLRLLV